MKDVSGDESVAHADLHSEDHLGAVFVMGLVPGERHPLRVLPPGQTITFRLRVYELVGEGMMQCPPPSPQLADWGYTVEND